MGRFQSRQVGDVQHVDAVFMAFDNEPCAYQARSKRRIGNTVRTSPQHWVSKTDPNVSVGVALKGLSSPKSDLRQSWTTRPDSLGIWVNAAANASGRLGLVALYAQKMFCAIH